MLQYEAEESGFWHGGNARNDYEHNPLDHWDRVFDRFGILSAFRFFTIYFSIFYQQQSRWFLWYWVTCPDSHPTTGQLSAFLLKCIRTQWWLSSTVGWGCRREALCQCHTMSLFLCPRWYTPPRPQSRKLALELMWAARRWLSRIWPIQERYVLVYAANMLQATSPSDWICR